MTLPTNVAGMLACSSLGLRGFLVAPVAVDVTYFTETGRRMFDTRRARFPVLQGGKESLALERDEAGVIEIGIAGWARRICIPLAPIPLPCGDPLPERTLFAQVLQVVAPTAFTTRGCDRQVIEATHFSKTQPQ